MLETAQVFINRKMDKLQYSHTMKEYSGKKKKKELTTNTPNIWVNLQNTVSEETSRKSTCCVLCGSIYIKI